MKKISALLIAFMMVACGSQEEAQQTISAFSLDIEFSEVMTASEKESLSQEIEYYRFIFSGSFAEKNPVDVESKKFEQYVFEDIPADERLTIRVEALSLNKQVRYCQGEVTLNYYPGKQDRVLIKLECYEN